MPIFFTAIAKEKKVLAQHAIFVGNYSKVMMETLTKISCYIDSKKTHSCGPYHFYCIVEDRMLYICITDNSYPENKAFDFLEDIKCIFLMTFSETPQSSKLYASPHHPKYMDFIGILENRMNLYRKFKVRDIKKELENVKRIMQENVHKMVTRGERLEDLMCRADGLATNSVSFRNNTTVIKRKLKWQYYRWYVVLALALIVMVYLIGVVACGGFSWQRCTG